MAEAPLGITIVTGGRNRGQTEFWQSVRHTDGMTVDDWHYVDLTEHLHKNPGTTIGHQVDGSSPDTQRVVIGQYGIVALLIKLLHIACGTAHDTIQKVCFALFCNSGYHRADTIGRFLKCVLNYVCDIDGNRMFNASHFSLLRNYTDMIESALTWRFAPWVVREGGVVPRPSLYGYDACMDEHRAAENWIEVYDEVDRLYPHEPLSGTTIERVAIAPPTPSPPPPPPPPVRASSSASDDRANVEHTPAQPAYPPSAHLKGGKGAHTPSPEVPTWATFERNAHVWYDELCRLGVDKHACKDLFLLAQLSDVGYAEANNVLSKLIKKDVDGDTLNNVSAFVHSSVMSARYRIDPRGDVKGNQKGAHHQKRHRTKW